MTVALQSPKDGSRISCHGVIVGCAGNKHTGYHISLVFTGLTRRRKTAWRDGALRSSAPANSRFFKLKCKPRTNVRGYCF